MYSGKKFFQLLWDVFQIDEYGSSETIRIKEIRVLVIVVSVTIIKEINQSILVWLEVDQGFQNRKQT